MRGYPNGPLSKTDFENLCAIPEHADRAKEDLTKLAALKDSKIIVDQGTEKEPKLVEIDNPLPAWKRAGFRDKAELISAAVIDIKPTDDEIVKKRSHISHARVTSGPP